MDKYITDYNYLFEQKLCSLAQIIKLGWSKKVWLLLSGV
jgi:hypothetical protein